MSNNNTTSRRNGTLNGPQLEMEMKRGYWAGWHTIVSGKPFSADITHKIANIYDIAYEDGRLAAIASGSKQTWPLPAEDGSLPKFVVDAIYAAYNSGASFSKAQMQREREKAEAGKALCAAGL